MAEREQLEEATQLDLATGPPGDSPDTEPKRLRSLEDLISLEHLRIISEASGGFSFRPARDLEAEFYRTGTIKTGYTNKETRTIYFNPVLLNGDVEHGIEPWRQVDAEGFTYHEAGHHAPEVLEVDNLLFKTLTQPENVPESYKGDPDTEMRFFRAVNANLNNGIIDMWLESYMSRRPYFMVRKSITDFQSAKGEMADYRPLPKPDQLIQVLLRSRYIKQENLENKVDPEVFSAFQKIWKTGAMDAILNCKDYENFFATKLQKERAVERKVAAYKQVFLPEYIYLMELELEKRKQERQEQKEQQEGGEGEEGGQQQVKPQPGGGSNQESVPLSKEEQQEIANQLLEELEKKGHNSRTPDDEDEEKRNQRLSKLQKFLEDQKEAREQGNVLPQQEAGDSDAEPKQQTGQEVLRKLAEELGRKRQDESRRGLAESLGVKQESVDSWERIKEKYAREIESTAAILAEIFLEDRRSKLEYLQREGEIVPGLEFETVAAVLSGQLDPETNMRTVRNPQFLETEMESIVDTSGSMAQNQKIKQSVIMQVVVTEAFLRVRELLADEDLLMEDEQPFRLGVTKFAAKPERVTKLNDPLTAAKEIRIIDKLSEVGGGTDETGAISGVYHEMKLNANNVIKIIVIFTDGVGNREGVEPILRQIEEDNEVIFLAIALGDNQEGADAIVQTYLEPLRDREANVYGFGVDSPEKALPQFLDFLKREVSKRRGV
jgi:hypothetical protein